MGTVSSIRIEEGVRVDPDRVLRLAARLGRIDAAHLISATRQDLIEQFARIELAVGQGDAGQAAWTAVEVERLADQVGMIGLARVARDLRDCCARDDRPALEAVTARLIRIGERSLSAMGVLAGRRG